MIRKRSRKKFPKTPKEYLKGDIRLPSEFFEILEDETVSHEQIGRIVRSIGLRNDFFNTPEIEADIFFLKNIINKRINLASRIRLWRAKAKSDPVTGQKQPQNGRAAKSKAAQDEGVSVTKDFENVENALKSPISPPITPISDIIEKTPLNPLKKTPPIVPLKEKSPCPLEKDEGEGQSINGIGYKDSNVSNISIVSSKRQSKKALVNAAPQELFEFGVSDKTLNPMGSEEMGRMVDIVDADRIARNAQNNDAESVSLIGRENIHQDIASDSRGVIVESEETGEPIMQKIPVIDSRSDAAWIPARFATFWKEYPKKVAKSDAIKSFTKIIKKQPDVEKFMEILMASLSWWKKQQAWNKDSGKYVPYPATWLNRGNWQDSVENDKSDTAEFLGNSESDEELIKRMIGNG